MIFDSGAKDQVLLGVMHLLHKGFMPAEARVYVLDGPWRGTRYRLRALWALQSSNKKT